MALLQKAIVEHLEKHRSVYGSLDFLPKHHFALHLPQQIARDQALTDTFVVERSHLLPRQIANEIDNSTTFEKSTITRVRLERMSSLESIEERVGLTGKDAAMCPELSRALGADVAVAAGAHIDGIRIERDDVLLVDGYTIKLSDVCKTGERYFLLGYLFQLIRTLSESSSVWTNTDDLHMLEWSGQRVRRCHAWSQRGDGTWLTLQPVLR